MNIYGFEIDFWTIWGFVAQLVFFSSFVVQWWKSERARKSHLPSEFWYLRIIGSSMLLAYVMVRRDLVFLVAIVLQLLLYGRNIQLMRKQVKSATESDTM